MSGPEKEIKVDPDVVAGLGNDLLSISTRLRSKPAAVGTTTIDGLGRAGEGSTLAQTYAHVTQTATTAVDTLCGALETNGEYVLYAAQNSDDAFN